MTDYVRQTLTIQQMNDPLLVRFMYHVLGKDSEPIEIVLLIDHSHFRQS